MKNETKLQGIERRLAALEQAVASLTANKNTGKHSNEPCGRFAHLGGIDRGPIPSFGPPERAESV